MRTNMPKFIFMAIASTCLLLCVNNYADARVFMAIAEPGGGGGGSANIINESGNISANTTWQSGTVHYISGDITVDSGVTLTIEPNVNIVFTGNYSFVVNGTLNAAGSSAGTIRFTTNQSQTPGVWQGIHLNNSSDSVLKYVSVKYSSEGIRINGGTPSISFSAIQTNNKGLILENDAAPNLWQNSFTDNAEYNLYVANGTAGVTVNAEYNHWGSVDPALIAEGIWDNADDANLPNVDFTPFLSETVNVNFGERTSGYISNRGEVDLYRFVTTNDNEHLIIPVAVGNTHSVYQDLAVRIYDSEGNEVLADTVIQGESSTLLDMTFDTAGAYYIWIKDNNYRDTSYGYAFTIEKVVDPVDVVDVNYGQRASGSISASSEIDIFRFTTTVDNEHLIIPVAVGNTHSVYQDLAVRIYDSEGNEVLADTVIQGESSTLLDMTFDTAGAYYIWIKDNNYRDTSYGYAFTIEKVVDPVDVVDVNLGDTISSSISASSEIDIYRLVTSVDNEHLIMPFAVTGRTNVYQNPTAKIYDSLGNEVLSDTTTSSSTIIDVTLGAAGAYYIWIKDDYYNTVLNYRFTLNPSETPVVTADINYGETSVGSIVDSRELDIYRFSAQAGEKILIPYKSLSSDPEFKFLLRIFNSSGQKILEENGTVSGELSTTISTADTYYLYVHEDDYQQTGDYEFTLERLNVPIVNSAVNFGDTVDGTISQVTQTDFYQLLASANDKLEIALTSASSPDFNLDVRVLDASGNELANVLESENNILNVTLPNDGNYYIWVSDDDRGQTGSYEMSLEKLNSPVNYVPVNFGDTISSTISERLERDFYQVLASANDKLEIALTSASSPDFNLDVRVLDSSGNELAAVFESESNILNVTLPNDGNYYIWVSDDDREQTGDYEISLEKINSPSVINGISQYDSPINSTTSYVTKSDIYKFTADGTTSAYVKFNNSSGAGEFKPYVRLYDANGTELAQAGIQSEGSDSLLIANGLTLGEDYYIFIGDDNYNATGSYEFTLYQSIPPGMGTVVSGSIGTTTWMKANSPYWVVGSVYTGTLTVEPGVEVIVTGPYSIGASITSTYMTGGTLLINGTAAEPVIFHSDEGSQAGPGDWVGLYTNGGTVIDHAIIKYASYGSFMRHRNWYSSSPAYYIDITNSVFQNNTYGIYFHDRTVFDIQNNIITDNTTGVLLSGYYYYNIPRGDLEHNVIMNNTDWNLYCANNNESNREQTNARNNYWGTTDPYEIAATIRDYLDYGGAYHPPLVIFTPFLDAEDGEPIGAGYLYGTRHNRDETWTEDNNPYIPITNVAYSSGNKVTIEPGVEVKFDGDYSITANIDAQGTPGNEILFTSNAEAHGEIPAMSDWNKISLTSSASKFDHVIVEYGDIGIDPNGYSADIKNSVFRHNRIGVDYDSVADPVFVNNYLHENDIGLDIGTASAGVFKNNSFENNTTYNLSNASNSTIDFSNNWWGTSDVDDALAKIKYPLAGTFTPLAGHRTTGTITEFEFNANPDSALKIILGFESGKNINGRFGQGWFLKSDSRLTNNGDGTIVIVDAKGNTINYAYNDVDRYVSTDAGVFNEVFDNGDGTWTLKTPSGEETNYDSLGRVTSIVSRDGSYVNFSYDPAGLMPVMGRDGSGNLVEVASDYQVSQITDDQGNVVDLLYDETGRLQTLRNNGVDHLGFGYDDATFDLTLISDLDAEDPNAVDRIISYDNNHQITSVENEYFEHIVDSQYAPESPIELQEILGESRSFGHQYLNTVATDDSGNETEYKLSASGFVTAVNQFDSSGNPVISKNYVLNKDYLRTHIDDNVNNVFVEFVYDTDNADRKAQGNVVQIIETTPSDISTTYITYTPDFNLIDTVTDDLGNVATYIYDAAGNLVDIDNPQGIDVERIERLLLQKDPNNLEAPLSAMDSLSDAIMSMKSPVILPIADKIVSLGEAVKFFVELNSLDVASVSVSSGPGNVGIFEGAFRYTWTPSSIGTYEVTLEARDASSTVLGTRSFRIKVNSGIRPPVRFKEVAVKE